MADAPLPKSLIDPIGDSGLRAYGGVINEEFLRDLQGDKGRRIYKEMSQNDATIGAILEGFTALICGVEWTVTAADDTDEADEGKRFLEGVLEDMETPLSDVIAEACTMFIYGFAPMEFYWKRRAGRDVAEKRLRSKFDDGRWGIQAIELRSQTSILRWEYTPEGELTGMWQLPTWKRPTVLIPMSNIALFRTTNAKSSPEGVSVLRRIYRAWRFKSVIEEIEAIGVERDLAGLPVARIPSEYMDPNADAPMKAVAAGYQKMVSQLRRESREGVIMPSDTFEQPGGGSTGLRKFDLQLLTSGGARTFDTSAIIDRYDRKMATAVLMDFIFLGQQAVGSFALSSSKTALFAQALKSYLMRMADVFNRKIIPELWDINGLPFETMPKMTPGDLENPDLNELAGFLSTLAGAGMPLFPDRELENHFRKLLGVPLAPEDETLGPQGAPETPANDDDDDWELPPKVAKAYEQRDARAVLADLRARLEA